MTNPRTTASMADAWAEVRAHDQVMRYRRTGAGPAVLVLRSSGGPDSLWPELTDALAARFRLIVPEVPKDCADATAWFTDFLEGLGTSRVAVVASDRFCLSAIELVLRDAERVRRVVLVPDGGGDEPGIDGMLAAVPLLVVRRGLAREHAIPLVESFLLGE